MKNQEEKCFRDGKEIAMKKLKKAVTQDMVDEKIIPLLDIINQSEKFYTSSSCAGRILLLQIPEIGDKKNAKFLGKWHRIIEPQELLSTVEKAEKGQLWLLAQSPIIHITAKTSLDAEKMLKTAISCGFKNSNLKSIGKKIVLEICSTERLDAPIGKDAILFCNDEHLNLLIDISNDVVEKSNLKLAKLQKELKKKI